MGMADFYITTTAPYVNADPHIGFALEIVQADTLARYHRNLGNKVFFNTGTDEHGQKIYQKTLERKQDPQEYVDKYAARFNNLKSALNLSYNSFWRSTNPQHIKAAQEMWRRVSAAGFIEKGIYKTKYCVGCELEKTNSDLENGKCPLHPNQEIQFIEEENYFFKFSKLTDRLLAHYKKYPDFVVPANRLLEIKNFVNAGLRDFSISRKTSKMPWGISVPDDPKHVMYVWFDALVYYISALGWPKDKKKFEKFWGTVEKPNAIQIAGKDNLRQQAAMWQTMLLAAGLPPTRQIIIHGFITSNGQKMSKSLGNVVNPFDLVKKYGTDAVRYFLLAKIDPFNDSDFTTKKFEEAYQSDLANGLGNLVQRVAKMCEHLDLEQIQTKEGPEVNLFKKIEPLIQSFRFNEALETIWFEISSLDKFINNKKPWELIGNKKELTLKGIIVGTEEIKGLRDIAQALEPFLPQTAEKIKIIFSAEKITAPKIPLFPRLDKVIAKPL